jgi:hypothetical protein
MRFNANIHAIRPGAVLHRDADTDGVASDIVLNPNCLGIQTSIR